MLGFSVHYFFKEITPLQHAIRFGFAIEFSWNDMEQALRQITESVSLLEYQVVNRN